MAGTVTSKLVQKISVEQSDEEIKNSLHTVLDDLKMIYSYLVYAEYKNEVLIRWKIEYTISQDDRYNTLDAENLVDEIFNILKSSTEKKVSSVIGYKQPSLEIQLEVFEPFINKLAIKQVKKWPCLEYDDAHQICQLTMLNLYRKGYYLHSSLMELCYENDILLFLRSHFLCNFLHNYIYLLLYTFLFFFLLDFLGFHFDNITDYNLKIW